MNQTPRTRTDKYSNSTERFLCAAPLKMRQRRCRPAAQRIWSRLLSECTSTSKRCVQRTAGRCNPAAAQPRGEYGATLQPRGQGCPQVSSQGHPSPLPAARTGGSQRLLSILQAPRHIWRSEHSNMVASTAIRAALRPAEREPGVQPRRATRPGYPHRQRLRAWHCSTTSWGASPQPALATGQGILSSLVHCLPALRPPQHATALLGRWLLESVKVAAESPAGRAPTPAPGHAPRARGEAGTPLGQLCPSQHQPSWGSPVPPTARREPYSRGGDCPGCRGSHRAGPCLLLPVDVPPAGGRSPGRYLPWLFCSLEAPSVLPPLKAGAAQGQRRHLSRPRWPCTHWSSHWLLAPPSNPKATALLLRVPAEGPGDHEGCRVAQAALTPAQRQLGGPRWQGSPWGHQLLPRPRAANELTSDAGDEVFPRPRSHRHT